MWESYGLDNEDLLWSCTAFLGGIAGYQKAPCGAVSASAVCLGLRHRCSLDDKEKVQQARQKTRQKARKLVQSFTDTFGTIICQELLGVDFSDPQVARQFFQSGKGEGKCNSYVQFIIEQLYELDDN